ncbi:MAG: hypothetical protein GY702_21390 [Desulfobulbaceae bacterium]|nr:hypothetical protein [Desulfobulbaceae bacterium]
MEMKPKKDAFIIFLSGLSLCFLLAVISFFYPEIKSEFQQKKIPSPLLSYGETGKILKKLDYIQPIENKKSIDDFSPNTLEFIQRATREQQKWLPLERYKQYRNNGVFGYIEMRSDEQNIAFAILGKKNDTWVKLAGFKITPDHTVYPFFLDIEEREIDIQFIFDNQKQPVKISGMAFLQHGSHPLVYTDPISFKGLVKNHKNSHVKISSSGMQVAQADSSQFFRGRLSFTPKWMVGISKFHKKQGNTQIELIAKHHHPIRMQSSLANEELSAISVEKIPVIAIDVDEKDLYSDEYGILKNYAGHGRRWERLSYVRMYRNGKSVFSNFSGIRLQGGDPGREKGLINFRLFFREDYGKSSIEAEKLFGGNAGNIKRLAIKQSEWPKWPLNTPIAYDISRQIGALAPPTELVLLYLNGKELGLYYIVPHLGEKQIQSMLPEDAYQYFRIRGKQHTADKHFFNASLWKKFMGIDTINETYAEQHFDLENLSRQLFSFLANGTGDFCQGVALKAESAKSTLFWYSWDMDHSYIDVAKEVLKNKTNRERWQQSPSIEDFFFNNKGQEPHYCGRIQLFQRLVNEDPQFRQKVKHLFTSIMNHQLTDDFISELLDTYQSKLRAISYPDGDEYMAIVRDFFDKRVMFLLRQMENDFPRQTIKTCEVTSDRYPIKVDGFIKRGPFQGLYFPGSTLKIEPEDGFDIKYLLLNGKKIAANSLSMGIDSNTNCKVQVFH